MAILLLSIGAGYAAFRLQPTTSNERLAAVSSPDSEVLYAYGATVWTLPAGADGRDYWDVTALDPETLADRTAGAGQSSTPPGWVEALSYDWTLYNWVLAADGSTYVAIDSRHTVDDVPVKEATIHVYDGQTGAERDRFDLPIFVEGHPRLNYDGSRLVIQAHPDPSQIGGAGIQDPPEWYVVDTADGHVIAKIESDGKNGWHSDSWIDPTASRLYRLFVPYSSENTGPGATKLVANDLTTGLEVAQLELPDVRSGVWNTGRTHEPWLNVFYPIMAELRPGVAVSPDGKILAIVHADEDAVTVIDAERLVVGRTEPLGRPVGWGDRLLGLLLPTDAAAKGAAEGTVLQAVFAADGRHLYVFGSETSFDDEGEADARSLGLRLIDLDDAEIVVDSPELANAWFSQVMPSPNGQDLYVQLSSRYAASPGTQSYTLWRLDATTLEVQAERDFAVPPQIVFSPSIPNGRGQLPPGAG